VAGRGISSLAGKPVSGSGILYVLRSRRALASPGDSHGSGESVPGREHNHECITESPETSDRNFRGACLPVIATSLFLPESGFVLIPLHLPLSQCVSFRDELNVRSEVPLQCFMTPIRGHPAHDQADRDARDSRRIFIHPDCGRMHHSVQVKMPSLLALNADDCAIWGLLHHYQ